MGTQIKPSSEYQSNLELAIVLAQEILKFGTISNESTFVVRANCPFKTHACAVALFTKASLSFQSVLVLCELGLDRTSMPIARSLFETLLCLAFVTRDKVSLLEGANQDQNRKSNLDLYKDELSLESRADLLTAWSLLEEQGNNRKLQQVPELDEIGRFKQHQLLVMVGDPEKLVGDHWARVLKKSNTCVGLNLRAFAVTLDHTFEKWYLTIYAEFSKSVHQSDLVNYLIQNEEERSIAPEWNSLPEQILQVLCPSMELYLWCVREMSNLFEFGDKVELQLRKYHAKVNEIFSRPSQAS